tara:strand:+ start:278 stop:520 length:243 start_codon:yes stop_codon:yes gene_type:complete
VIASLTEVSELADLTLWANEFGTTHVLVADQDRSVWNQYVDGGGRPQYVVFDREMNIVFKGKSRAGKAEAEEAVLELLKK